MNSKFESSSFNESPLLSRSRASSTSSYHNSPFLLPQPHNTTKLLFSHLQQKEEEEELETVVNIYHEHRDHLEEDKKARTVLDIEILNDDLYCPVQEVHTNNNNNNKNKKSKNNKTSSRGLSFTSFFPRFSLSTNNNYSGVTESSNTDTWGYTTLGGFDVSGVACQ